VTFSEETGGQPAARTSYENLPGDSKDHGALEPWNLMTFHFIPSGKHTKNYGKSPFSMGKSTISMAVFNSYVSLPEGIWVIYGYGSIPMKIPFLVGYSHPF